MKLRLSLNGRSIVAILVIAMLGVGLACAGDKATPTSPPTAITAPTATATTAPPATLVPAATATLVPGAPTPTATAVPTATATAVPEPTATSVPQTWIQKYMQSPGYKPEWGQPQTGGTFVFGSNRDTSDFNPALVGGCYNHGCWSELAYNSLLRIDPWVGLSSPIEGDVARSWEMSGDGKTLTIQLWEGIKFYDNPNLPKEVADKVNGDEFVCEDARASFERMAWPPKWERPIMTTSRALLSHLESLSCPDGPRGYTFVMHFDPPLARTVSALSRGLAMLDKDWIEWLHSHEANIMRDKVPDNFLWQSGTGAFVPVSIEVGSTAKWERNPNYWREGLPLLDRYVNVVIKDPATRFTALATGNIHFYGEGSYGFTADQAAQALRDFPDRIVVHPQMNQWSRTMYLNTLAPPFSDWRVREAVTIALDREEWRLFRQVRVGNTVLEGARMAYSLPPDTFYARSKEEIMSWPGWRQPKDQDIAEANRLLDEVFGQGKRPKTSCLAPTPQPSDIDACLFVMDQLKKQLNWEVTSDFLDTAPTYDKRSFNNFTMTAGSGSMSTATGDPDDNYPTTFLREYVSSQYGGVGSLQGLWDENPQAMERLESLYWAQSRELDPQKRRQLVWEMEDHLRTVVHSWHIMVEWTNIFPSWRTEVKGIKGYDYYSYTKGAMWERVWLAKK